VGLGHLPRRQGDLPHHAFGIPALFHPLWVVLAYYAVAALVLGTTMSVVFQLAHCVEEAEFPLPRPDTGRIEHARAIHQMETTVNFARRSGVAAWLLGGLNCQIEHHLFLRICDINYRGHVEGGGGHLSRVWRDVEGTPVRPSGSGVACPLAATDGKAESDRLSV
jgi:hypothetical protein